MKTEEIKEKIDEAQRCMEILLPSKEFGENTEASILWDILESFRKPYDIKKEDFIEQHNLEQCVNCELYSNAFLMYSVDDYYVCHQCHDTESTD